MTSTSALLLLADQLRARSAQREIGWSDIGGCRRRTRYKIDGYEPVNRVSSVTAMIGTAVHEQLKTVLDALGMPAEWEVEYAGIKGHFDRYEVEHHRVVDTKGLALDTPLATPTGWTTMGDVHVGDFVYGRDGRPCRVTHKSEVKNIGCFKVTFDDGTHIVCDEEHLWETTHGRTENPKTAVLPISDIRDTLRGNDGQRQHRIRNTEYLQCADVDLPIDPYVLGLWLGDGSRSSGVITSADQEVWENIEKAGYRLGVNVNRNNEKTEQRTVLGLMKQLRAAGVLFNKHVPSVYLRAPGWQRIALLRGLMDSDGCCNPARGGEVSFTQKDEAIARAVHELAVSLGERATINPITNTGFGITGQYWKVVWRPNFNPFLLGRKSDKVQPASTESRRRLIISVEEVPSVPTQCIAVDNEDHMYLAGRQMVPTHNTTTSRWLESIKLHGPPFSHIWQCSGYCAALIAKGVPVETFRIDYLCRDTGEEWQYEQYFSMKDIRDALEWLDDVKSVPFDLVPRDYEPDSAWCTGCPFGGPDGGICWSGGVPDRDRRSVMIAEGADTGQAADDLFQTRKQIKELKAKETRLKGILDGLRPDDTSVVVQAGDRYLSWSPTARGWQLRFTSPPQKKPV